MKQGIDSFRRIAWRARHAVDDFGWPGIAAGLLFASCAAFGYFVIRPVQAHIHTLQSDAASLRKQTRATLATEHKTLSPADQLAAFYRFFPQQDTAFDWMAKLYNAAEQQNLSLEQGEYKLARDHDGKLIRYDIVLPVKGGYVQIRKFIAQAMADVPSLSLDGIAFVRQKVEETAVDAQIRFTLYLSAE